MVVITVKTQNNHGQVFGFGGIEQWNGTVDWTGLDWNGMNGLDLIYAQCAPLGHINRLPRSGDFLFNLLASETAL